MTPEAKFFSPQCRRRVTRQHSNLSIQVPVSALFLDSVGRPRFVSRAATIEECGGTIISGGTNHRR